jgi:hypothetical protein
MSDRLQLLIMNKLSLIFLLLIFLFFSSCSKNDNAVKQPEQLPPTTLIFIVKKSDMTYATGLIYLYKNITDYINGNSNYLAAIGPNGRCTLTEEIRVGTYYFLIESGCENNIGGIFSCNVMYANQENFTQIHLSKKGTLKIHNASANYYHVIKDSTDLGSVPAGTVLQFDNMLADAVSVHVVQETGIIGSPLDTIYHPVISCGGITTITFL